ncbi:fibrous sheath-interacting protein 1 isoform X2 [Amia ocellicauda]|uniref:fibrous sheath-interacting protein 1 isoform X2 n=1 Tax=Amia ocellicauda TaxID=2972642 RepID=UPI003464E334
MVIINDMDIVKGSLDDISRPPSGARSRPGSRAAGSARSGSLVVLAPDVNDVQDPMLLLEDMSFSSDSSDGFEDLKCDLELSLPSATKRGDGEDHSHAVSGERDYSVQEQQRNKEMNTSPVDSEDNDEKSDNTSSKLNESDEENEDPELHKAIKKMKQLDKILAHKISKEREVKKKGKELRLKLWEELQDTKSGGVLESYDEAENTRRFLSLSSYHDSCSREDMDFVPLFDTQIPAKEYDRGIEHTEKTQGDQVKKSDLSKESPGEGNPDQAASRQGGGNRGKKKQDFVKKNIELAKDAGSHVLMTDKEKKRLAELLKDIDKQGNADLPSAEEDSSMWAVPVATGVGYTSEAAQLDQLIDIDSKLQALLSVEDFLSLCSPHSSHTLLQTERPKLTEDQLICLLEECVRAQSRIESSGLVEDPSPRSAGSSSTSTPPLSSGLLTAKSTPRLSESVLSQLQQEACQSERSSQIDEDDSNSSLVEDISVARHGAVVTVSQAST